MSDTQEPQHALRKVEVVDYPLIADAQPVSVNPFQPLVCVAVQTHSQTVNAVLDPRLKWGG